MKQPPMTEAEMAAKVVAHLESEGWTVYQEVAIHVEGRRADIVAVRGDEIRVVECKLSLSFELLHQVAWWQQYATTAWIAVPKPNRKPKVEPECRAFAWRVLRKFGMGAYEVASLWPLEEQSGRVAVSVRCEAVPDRRPIPGLREALRPGHQTHAKAGTKAGGHFTPFRQTCEAIGAFAKANPGASLLDALIMAGHHYASLTSAVGSLADLASKGKLRDFEIREVDGVRVVFPPTAAEPGRAAC